MIRALPVISITPDALSQPTGALPLDQILNFMRTGDHRKSVEAIRRTFTRVLAETGDSSAAKKAINDDKKKLPGLMFGGRFTARGDKNLADYSRLLCGDVDNIAPDRMEDVFNAIAGDPHCISASISPSGAGIKFLCWSTGTADEHKRAFAAMAKYFLEKHGVEVDQACKNLERLCFAPDNATPENFDATAFNPLPEEKNQSLPVFSAPIGESRSAIAERLLGRIEWKDEATGFCKCPGEHLHSTGNGARDCMVLITGAPTIKCFHDSCSGIVAGVNHELRSLIGKAEFVPTPRLSRPSQSAPTHDSDSPPDSIYDEYIGQTEVAEVADSFPDLLDATDFLGQKIEPPAELIGGILHKGSKLAFGGGSKSFKTWCLLDMAISVATGREWMGRKTEQGRVLFLNFEIQPFAWQNRINAVAKAKGVALERGQVTLWNLRGHASDFRRIIPRVVERCKNENFALTVLDPIYKLYGKTDENAAGDVAELLNSLESLAVTTGTAIAFGAHFAKGNASGKEAIDRISGSGVFARDPDSLLIFTKHEEDDAFTVEPILRNFAPISPFAVRWNFPLMEHAEDLDPAKLKSVAGRTPTHTASDLLSILPEDGLSSSDWQAESTEKGISRATFFRLKKQLENDRKIHFSKISDFWMPILHKNGSKVSQVS